jgi:hypothetical protein
MLLIEPVIRSHDHGVLAVVVGFSPQHRELPV